MDKPLNREKRAQLRVEVFIPTLISPIECDPKSQTSDCGHIYNFNDFHALVLSNVRPLPGTRVILKVVEMIATNRGLAQEDRTLEGKVLFSRPIARNCAGLDYESECVIGLDEPFPARALLENKLPTFGQMEEFGSILQYEKLLDESKDVIFIIDLQGKFVRVSKNTEILTGYTYEELIGQNVYSFAIEESCKKIKGRIENWIRGIVQPESVDIQVKTKDGSLVDLRYFSWPIRIRGELRYVQGIARDVTEQKLEENLRKHLAKMYDSLENMDGVFEGIQDAVAEIFTPCSSQICLHSSGQGFLVVRSARGTPVNDIFDPIVDVEDCPVYKKTSAENAGKLDSLITAKCCSNFGDANEIRAIPLKTRKNEINAFVCFQLQDGASPPKGAETVFRNFSSQAGSAIECSISLFIEKILGCLLDEFNVGRDLNDYLTYVIKLISKEINVEACSIFISDREGLLRLKATTGLKGEPRGENVFYYKHEGNTGKVATTGKILLTSHRDQEPTFLGKYEEKTTHGIKRWIGVPFKNSKGLTVGVLRCMNRNVDNQLLDSVFFPHDIEFLTYVARLCAMVIELSTSTEALRNRLRRIRHELLNPIVGIRGNASFILRHQNDERFSNYDLRIKLEDMLEECELLALQSGSIVTASEEKLTLELVPTDLYNDVINKCMNMLKALIREQGFNIDKIESSFPLKKLPKIRVDKLRFEEVIYNVLINAIKYAKDAKSFRIFISGEIINKECLLKFSDYGIGIEPDEAESIFIEGYRSAKQAQKQATGTGMGLTIAKKIVLAHGGKIWVSSLHDPTEFTISFPQT